MLAQAAQEQMPGLKARDVEYVTVHLPDIALAFVKKAMDASAVAGRA